MGYIFKQFKTIMYYFYLILVFIIKFLNILKVSSVRIKKLIKFNIKLRSKVINWTI